MGEEEVGGLSGKQIPQGFTILVRRMGCSPEGKQEQVKSLNSERSGQIYIRKITPSG